MLFSKTGKFFEFSKNGMNVTEPYKAYMFTNFQMDILKNDKVLMFWKVKNSHFSRCLLRFLHFPIIKICAI